MANGTSAKGRWEIRDEVLTLLDKGPLSLNSLSGAHLAEARVLVEQGLVVQDGIGSDGRMRYRLAACATYPYPEDPADEER